MVWAIITGSLLIVEIVIAVLLYYFFSRWNLYLEKKIYNQVLVSITTKDGTFYTWVNVRDYINLVNSRAQEVIYLETKEGTRGFIRDDLVSVKEIKGVGEIVRRVF